MANNNWMASYGDDRALNSLIFPGSHDACMYETKDGTSKSTVNSTITQFNDLQVQLEAGARFFDIRVYEDGSTLRAGHFASKSRAILGAYGPTFADVIQEFPRFLVQNRSEAVIIKFSLAKAAKAKAIKLIESQWVNFLYDCVAPRTLANVQLGAVRQKIIAVFDKPVGTMESKLHLVSKTTPQASRVGTLDRSTLFLQGDAPVSNSIVAVVAKQNAKRAAARGAPLAAHLSMFYLTITATTGDVIKGNGSIALNTAREFGLTPTERSAGAATKGDYRAWDSSAPAKYLNAVKWVGPGPTEPNIYMIDFVNGDVCGGILGLNSTPRVAAAPPAQIQGAQLESITEETDEDLEDDE